MLDEPSYQALSPPAKLVFFTLKLELGVSGIDVLNAASHVVAQLTGYAAGEVGAAFDELKAAGRIRFEGNVFEIVGGLDAEPNFKLANLNHRKSIQGHVNSLREVPIVADFRTSHPDWFAPGDENRTDNDLSPIAIPFDTHGQGHPDAIPITRKDRGEPRNEINPQQAGASFDQQRDKNGNSTRQYGGGNRNRQTSFEVLRGDGLIVFGNLHSKRQALQIPTGIRYVIPDAELETLSSAAKRALVAIGGASALASAEGDRYSIASGQFARAYAAAVSRAESATG
jgi:hypothetical protein